MSTPPLPHTYTDPNARLLASVVPPPPPSLGTRLRRKIEGFRGVDGRRALAGLLAFEAWHLWVVAGAASAGLLFGVYRTELSSAARQVRDTVPNVQLRELRAAEPAARAVSPAPSARTPGASSAALAGGGVSAGDVVPPKPGSTERVALLDAPSAQGSAPQGSATADGAVAEQGQAKPAVRRAVPRAAKHRAMLKKKAKARAQRRMAAKARRGKAKAKVAAGSSSGSERSPARRALANRARAIAFGRE